MAVEINNIASTHASTAGTDASTRARETNEQAVGTNPSGTGSSAPASDQVSLTPAAQQLKGLEQQVANLPEVNMEKVQALKEAIQNGTYEVNANSIASKMMSLEKALGDLG